MKVKELYSDASKWTKAAGAKNASGDTVKYDNPQAVCWCLHDAVDACYDGEDGLFPWRVRAKIRKHLEDGGWSLGIINWNDQPGRTFKEVKHLVETLDI